MKNNNDLFYETKVGDWLDAQFADDESGEVFFVEERRKEGEDAEDFIARCQEIADENFSDAEYLGFVHPDDAEKLGYDTY